MLRIIAGTLRGRKIEQPSLEITRPTTDKVREAIFSSIQFEIENSKVLDLFCGSGAMSFEAISRGAKEVDASEKERKVFNLIKSQILKLNVNNFNLYNASAQLLIEMKKEKKYNFIFLDPPYGKIELLNSTLNQIVEKNILENHGTIIVETNDIKKIEIPNLLEIYKHKKYGKTDILYIHFK